MVAEALLDQHPRASDSQRFTPKYSAALRMQEEHCGFPSRSVSCFGVKYCCQCYYDILSSFCAVVFKPVSLPFK